jgi:hypothetical protein
MGVPVCSVTPGLVDRKVEVLRRRQTPSPRLLVLIQKAQRQDLRSLPFCVFPYFLNVGVIKSTSDRYFISFPSLKLGENRISMGSENGPRAERGLGLR